VPTSSALCQARARLDAEPMRELYARVARQLAGAGTPGAWLGDLRDPSVFQPQCSGRRDADGGECLVDFTRSSNVGVMPRERTTLRPHSPGCCCSIKSRPANTPWAPISASQSMPSLKHLSHRLRLSVQQRNRAHHIDAAALIDRQRGLQPVSSNESLNHWCRYAHHLVDVRRGVSATLRHQLPAAVTAPVSKAAA
jgi:hypothetical protein